MKILYVEDDEHVKAITSRLLTSLGHEVQEAADATEARNLLSDNSQQIDCLILDKNLPNCSGLELLKGIRSSAWYSDVPAIMLTAESGNGSLIECLEGGVNLYLTKPATKDLLRAALDQVQMETSRRSGAMSRSKQLADALAGLSSGQFRFQTPSQANNLALLLCQQAEKPDRAYLGLFEIFLNAIQHGNLQVSQSVRQGMHGTLEFRAHLEELARHACNQTKWVEVDCATQNGWTTLTVTDQGKGFDWQHFLRQHRAKPATGAVSGFQRILNAGFESLHYINGGRTAVICIRNTQQRTDATTEPDSDSMAHIDPLQCLDADDHSHTVCSTHSAYSLGERSRHPANRLPGVPMSLQEGALFDRLNGELLKAINKITSGFIASNDFGKFFEHTLDVLLSVTQSEYGFLSELMYDDQQRPFMRAYAISNISWDAESRKRYQAFQTEGYMDFHAMDNLFGSVLISGEPLITNDPMRDPRSSGFPKGHWNMDAFLGIPLIGSGNVLGMVAIANRPGGYHKDMIDWLEPVRSTLSSIIISMRNERHRLMIERQLKEAKEIAERANDAKSFFLATISHEIRTPMNAIVGMSDLLLESPLTSSQTYFAQAINRNSELLLSIINDVLNLSKLKAGKMKVQESDFDLRTLLAEVAGLLGHSAVEKNLELIFNYPFDLPHRLHGDAAKIKQILINLINNAIKFTDEGHVLVEVKSAGADRLCIEVQDTGIGISEDALPQLFSLFHQIDQTASREHGGTGLGLAISQEFARLINGHIDIRSTEGVGSTFSFEFQATPSDVHQPPDLSRIGDFEVHVFSESAEVCRVAESHFRQFRNVRVYIHGADHAVINGGIPVNPQSAALVLAEQTHPAVNRIHHRQKNSQNGFLVCTVAAHSPTVSQVELFSEDNVLAVVPKHFGLESFEKKLGKIMTRLSSDEPVSFIEADLLELEQSTQSSAGDLVFSTQSPPSILLVEDNPINQDVASLVLTQMGCLVDVAFNGVQALEKFTRHSYDLIFMDCQMPVMDGLAATARIRDIEKSQGLAKTPIVAITANALPSDRLTCIHAGMDEYLAKPFKRSQVRDILSKFLPGGSTEKPRPIEPKPEQRVDDPSVFDAALMLEVTNNDWDLIAQILLRYKSTLSTQVSALTTLIEQGDKTELCSELHRMRGAAVATGFNGFSVFLKKIETAVRSGRPLDTTEIITRLNRYVREIMEFTISSESMPSQQT